MNTSNEIGNRSRPVHALSKSIIFNGSVPPFKVLQANPTILSKIYVYEATVRNWREIFCSKTLDP